MPYNGVLGKGMTPRKLNFCKEYIANGGNRVKAALAAGYAESTAYAESYKLMKQPIVKETIDRLNRQAVLEAGIDLTWALAEWKLLYDRCKDEGKLLEAIKTLENISKHLGFYFRDNQTKPAPVVINVEKIDVLAIAKRLEESC